jgi:hypothetical protein
MLYLLFPRLLAHAKLATSATARPSCSWIYGLPFSGTYLAKLGGDLEGQAQAQEEQDGTDVLLTWITKCYTAGWLMTLWAGPLGLLIAGPEGVFWTTTAWPLSRVPIFMAGIYAGLVASNVSGRW